jgi:hypothetical protein
MIFRDINKQSNELEEGSFSSLERSTNRIQKKSSAPVKKKRDLSKKFAAGMKSFKDAAFDFAVKDGKSSSDEEEKIQDFLKKNPGVNREDIKSDTIQNAIRSNKNQKYKNTINDKSKKIDNKTNNKENPGLNKKETELRHNKNLTLDTKQQVRLEKNIFNKDIKTKKTIYKSLLNLYNDLNSKKGLKTESSNIFSLDDKNLTDVELSKILTYINNAYKRNKKSKLQEDSIPKAKLNKVSKYWKESGKLNDKNSLVKLMKKFELTDNQIFTAFEKVNKTLTYSEIIQFGLELSTGNDKVTKDDLIKLTHTLGEFKLRQFLVKLKNDIQK